jgi:predicted MFS family arabinose efflux permease
LWSGRLADRTQQYWRITGVGYAVNLLSVPLLALVSHWAPAAALVLAERAGKAIRTPARDVMLSFATHATGRGWGFGLHEALDQIGATFGPLAVAGLLALGATMPQVFASLALPAVAALLLLLLARTLFPHPRSLEPHTQVGASGALPKRFTLYLSGAVLVAAGYADYPLIAFHLGRTGHLPAVWIAAAYGIAMAMDGIAALAFGRLFDRLGLRSLVFAALISAAFPILAFSRIEAATIAGILIWGVGMGAQEAILRAAVASLVPASRRGGAYGLFHLAYGVAWFCGSALMGYLYDTSLPALIGFATTAQLSAAVLFWLAARTRD